MGGSHLAMIRDEAAINNETAKLFASFLDALGLE